ncbi:shikimate O-hydroxycinnamoyltransferase [Salvia divinorum]|uniref:Shikimate O-hydroxycinnamoyltransferase n=1 Tax=Salvia divinorum TaxID=28513 RepID=A0ABD1HBA1_SALDI
MAQIIASDIVKPSSPTPNSSKTHTLSCLDQASPPVYINLIFFHENHQSKQREEISQRLKQSLSETLTIFYPLAGRIKQNSFIDCNDAGAEFVEALIHTRLSQFAENPKIEELEHLVPAAFSSATDDPILSVKTSYFDCGGVAIAVCFPHKIGDISSFATFMNAWATAFRGEASGIIRASFDLAIRFPPLEMLVSGLRTGITEEKLVTRRLVFDKDKVERIRKLEASRSEVKDPSRVEAVSAFLWRSFIEAHKQCAGGVAWFPAAHMVSLRRRGAPQVADHALGNCFTFAAAVVSADEDGDGDMLVSRLRAGIRTVDEDYVEAISEEEFMRELLNGLGDVFTKENCVLRVGFRMGKTGYAWINVCDDQFFSLIQANFNTLLN